VSDTVEGYTNYEKEDQVKGFFGFMASPAGRITRVVAGIALVVVGLFVIGDVAGYVVAAVGLVPLYAGVFDVCVFSRLFGGPFKGEEIRNQS
jgi:uncharacterized membrane protein HdeD (DUF308 family)